MDSAFDNLDAAGFLEIWQHFDADGENILLHIFLIFSSIMLMNNVIFFYSMKKQCNILLKSKASLEKLNLTFPLQKKIWIRNI